MGWVYEIGCYAAIRGVPVAGIYHVWDGDESETPDDVADVFETHHLPDLAAQQTDELTWNRISVTPLDVGNLNNPINRLVAIAGLVAGDTGAIGVHSWVKFQSDDNGFKSGGKLVGGLTEGHVTDGILTTPYLTALQTIFDDLMSDLITAGLTLAIYRPTLSTPGFPSISTVSAIFVRGVGTNNRRQEPFQK